MSNNLYKTNQEDQKRYKQFLDKADRKKELKKLPALHEAAFQKVNCLNCAACCKNYSPRFKSPDIRRISRYLGMKESELISKYLVMDEDGDYVVTTRPCPFLGSDNFCSIYDARPSDCSRFPYTDEDVLLKRKAITLKNATFCPAVTFVLDGLIK